MEAHNTENISKNVKDALCIVEKGVAVGAQSALIEPWQLRLRRVLVKTQEVQRYII